MLSRASRKTIIKAAVSAPVIAGVLLPSPELSRAVPHGAMTSAVTALSAGLPAAPARAEAAAEKGPCPAGMSHVSDFCIDTFEAHLIAGGAAHPHNERPAGGDFAAASEPGVYPQGYISRPEADAACQRSGKRLCRLSEWLEACRGAQNLLFPYGNRYEPETCNTGKQHLLSRLYGDIGPSRWKYDEHFNSPALNITPGFLSRTGGYPGCASPHGVFDLAGNLHEWVSDNVDSLLEGKIPLIEPIRKKLRQNFGHGIFMGGFYSTIHQHGYGCLFITIGHEPAYHDYSTGFRCCADSG